MTTTGVDLGSCGAVFSLSASATANHLLLVCCRKEKRGYPTDLPSQYEMAISRLKLKQWVHDSAQYVQMGMTASEFLIKIRNEINEQLQQCGAAQQISANQALNKLALCEDQKLLSKNEQQLLMEQIVIGNSASPLITPDIYLSLRCCLYAVPSFVQ